jgi:hypothetical protein
LPSSSPTPKQQDSAERAFNKLARTFTAQVEALKRYRIGGEQKITGARTSHPIANEPAVRRKSFLSYNIAYWRGIQSVLRGFYYLRGRLAGARGDERLQWICQLGVAKRRISARCHRLNDGSG